MAISFQLNLTPNQIEFLQDLDLYADGELDAGDLIPRTQALSPVGKDCFIVWMRKLVRERLVEHLTPPAGKRYGDRLPNGTVIRAYRITDKGRKVLSLIEDDVKAFIERQVDYQAKKKGKRA